LASTKRGNGCKEQNQAGQYANNGSCYMVTGKEARHRANDDYAYQAKGYCLGRSDSSKLGSVRMIRLISAAYLGFRSSLF